MKNPVNKPGGRCQHFSSEGKAAGLSSKFKKGTWLDSRVTLHQWSMTAYEIALDLLLVHNQMTME